MTERISVYVRSISYVTSVAIIITVWTVLHTVLTATLQSNGNGQNSTHRRIQIP